ncbi:VOC family protein [Cohnella sp. GbtcB17]|uniref:VOC family protein n=1 Tax=Cohnella sp. GbtcB17 TaxID=2824762 RepID=UPI001C304384|nr:VOC family protein [Cohnella sp. GbtcB17]
MTKELWINLPSKDLARTRQFYRDIGFTFNSNFPGGDSAVSLLVGNPAVVVMLFPEETFAGFASSGASDARAAAEVLLSIGADSREEVDTLAAKAAAAGGEVYGKPGESQGWMYGCGFADPDGHRWNVLYMDTEKMPGR